MLRIGVLTGGGDVPGLNPCIKQIVYRAVDAGHEVVGIRRGWAGLLNYNVEVPEAERLKWVIPLTKNAVRTPNSAPIQPASGYAANRHR